MSKLDHNKTSHADRLKDASDRFVLRQLGSDAPAHRELDTVHHDQRLHTHLTEVLELVVMALSIALATGLIFALSSDGLALLLFNPLFATAVLLGVVSLPYLAPAAVVTRDTELAKVLLCACAVIWGLAIAPVIRALPPPNGVQILVLAATATVALAAGAALVGAISRHDLGALSHHGREAAGLLLAATVLTLVSSPPRHTKAMLSVAIIVWSLTTVARFIQITKDALHDADDEDRRSCRAHIAAIRLIGPVLLIATHLVLVLRILPW